MQVGIHEAKTRLSQLLQKVLKGEEVIIAKSGTPIARLVSMINPLKKRTAGMDADKKFFIAPDFDAPLSDDLLQQFEK